MYWTSIILHLLWPTKNLATSSNGATVALSPILEMCVDILCSRSNDSDRCTPLLFSAKECISSIITHCTEWKCCMNFGLDSTIARLSGVVTKIWGGFAVIFCFSDAVV